MKFFKKRKENFILFGFLVLFLLSGFTIYSLSQFKQQQCQNFLKLRHDFYILKQKTNTESGVQILPAENTLEEVDVNSVVIGNIEDGKIHSFDDSFSIQIREVQETSEGVRFAFSIFNRDSVDYRDLDLKFQAVVEEDEQHRKVVSEVVSLTGTIKAGGQRATAVEFSRVDTAEHIRSIKVFVGK